VSTDLITTTGRKRSGSQIALCLPTAARVGDIDTRVGIAVGEGIGASSGGASSGGVSSGIYSGGVCK
jgi:hypothetical protein